MDRYAEQMARLEKIAIQYYTLGFQGGKPPRKVWLNIVKVTNLLGVKNAESFMRHSRLIAQEQWEKQKERKETARPELPKAKVAKEEDKLPSFKSKINIKKKAVRKALKAWILWHELERIDHEKPSPRNAIEMMEKIYGDLSTFEKHFQDVTRRKIWGGNKNYVAMEKKDENDFMVSVRPEMPSENFKNLEAIESGDYVVLFFEPADYQNIKHLLPKNYITKGVIPFDSMEYEDVKMFADKLGYVFYDINEDAPKQGISEPIADNGQRTTDNPEPKTEVKGLTGLQSTVDSQQSTVESKEQPTTEPEGQKDGKTEEPTTDNGQPKTDNGQPATDNGQPTTDNGQEGLSDEIAQKIIPIGNLLSKEQPQSLNLEKTKDLFGGSLLPKFTGVVYGQMGEGKTEFLWLLIEDLLKNLTGEERIIFFASEENPEYGRVSQRLKRLKFTDPNTPVDLIYSKSYNDFIEIVKTEKYRFALLDSVNKLQDYIPGAIDRLVDMYPKTSFVFLFHGDKSKKGNKGDTYAFYDGDWVAEVKEGIAYMSKNRDAISESKPLQVFGKSKFTNSQFVKKTVPFHF